LRVIFRNTSNRIFVNVLYYRKVCGQQEWQWDLASPGPGRMCVGRSRWVVGSCRLVLGGNGLMRGWRAPWYATSHLRALVVTSVAAMGSACAGVDVDMLMLVAFIRGWCTIFLGEVGLQPNRLLRAGGCLMVGAGGFAFTLVENPGQAGGVVTRGFPCHSQFRGGNRGWGHVWAYFL